MQLVFRIRGGVWLRPYLGALAIAFGYGASVMAQTPAATLLGVRFGVGANSTRVVMDLNQKLEPRLIAGGADKLVISVLAVPALETLQGEGHGLVKAWHVDPRPGGSRLTLDLAGPVQVSKRFLITPIGAAAEWRYVLDLVGPGFPVAEVQPMPAKGSRAERAANAKRRKVIVIDAGHGGHDPGAQGADSNEKDINLAAAIILKQQLSRNRGYRVVMTRDSDVFIPLEMRVKIARQAGADLFISLHSDSSGGDPTTHGASVYTLSDQGETRVHSVLGPHEWFNRTGGRKPDPAVGQILLDLTQRSTKNRSAEFAGLLVDRISDRTDLLPHSHRDAGYFVLLAPDVPAVLLEMGFVSSLKDEARLNDAVQRENLMTGVAEAIDSYFFGQTRLASR